MLSVEYFCKPSCWEKCPLLIHCWGILIFYLTWKEFPPGQFLVMVVVWIFSDVWLVDYIVQMCVVKSGCLLLLHVVSATVNVNLIATRQLYIYLFSLPFFLSIFCEKDLVVCLCTSCAQWWVWWWFVECGFAYAATVFIAHAEVRRRKKEKKSNQMLEEKRGKKTSPVFVDSFLLWSLFAGVLSVDYCHQGPVRRD